MLQWEGFGEVLHFFVSRDVVVGAGMARTILDVSTSTCAPLQAHALVLPLMCVTGGV